MSSSAYTHDAYFLCVRIIPILFVKGVFNNKYFRFYFDFKISCDCGVIHEQSESQKQISTKSLVLLKSSLILVSQW